TSDVDHGLYPAAAHTDTRRAWADESFDEADEGGVSVVCAAMFEVDLDHAREVMLSLRGGAVLHVEHKRRKDEPLPWAADVVAGACRGARQRGRTEFRDSLGLVDSMPR